MDLNYSKDFFLGYIVNVGLKYKNMLHLLIFRNKEAR